MELEAKQKLKREAAEREMERWKQMQQAADKENSHLQVQIDKLEDEARVLDKRMVELAAQEQHVRAHMHTQTCRTQVVVYACMCVGHVT